MTVKQPERLLLYVNADSDSGEVLDTPTLLELRHDLEDFVKEHPGKYEIWFFDMAMEPEKPDKYFFKIL